MRRMSVVLSVLFAALPLSAQQSPADGWLVIHGGGEVTNEVKERFIALAGGPNANFVMIPTAEDNSTVPTRIGLFGLKNVTVLHTRDRVRANSDGFVEPLLHASGVWISGGRQWRLADAYLGTAVEREIKALLARGGVVGGGSAGASIQASFLVRGAPATPGNPDGDNRIMMSPGHEDGFDLLPDSAIDQHIDARDRANDLAQVIRKHPNLLGIGIDQSAAIIVHGDSFFVVGGQVAIHDGQKHDGAPYYYLSPGQVFSLKTRLIVNTDDEEYNLILKVNTASRLRPILNPGGIVTEGSGLLESKDGSNQSINFRCNNVSLYSIGGNTYPARPDGPRQITIRARQINTDKLHEYTCTY
jgi:cyanophycinase